MKVPEWISTTRTTAGVAVIDSRDGAQDGVEGNSLLTAATGMVLLILLAVEGVTILSVRQMLTLHVVVGALLIGPVLLKSGSTFYRFARYYSGAAPYVKKGPPALPLRLIGPLVILSTLALLGTGVALILVGNTGSGLLLTAHQASFWIWVGLMTVHVLGHLWEAAVLSSRDLRRSLRGPAATGRRWRFVSIVVALVIGVAAAAALIPSTSSWTARPGGHSAPTSQSRQ
ncbi:MAG: hypothetical protein ABJD68_00775 [Nakamurella sp.]